jgi:hypothetical protein
MAELNGFSITGIPPFTLDFKTEYPVLAINNRYTHTTNAEVRHAKTGSLWSSQKPVYVKETFFLIADKDHVFKWLSPSESSFYVGKLIKNYAENKRYFTRYSVDKDMGECKNMINPVRPFSITGITMEGFSPEKEYPVLAIDMDQYIPNNQEKEENEAQELPETQTIAFFLVGDDEGEFAWIAEDECRLFPLKE